MKLLGRQILDFTDRQTGEVIAGIKLHFCYKDDNVLGEAVDAKFFRKDSPFYELAFKLPIGCDFKFDYTPKGKVCDLILLSDYTPAPAAKGKS